MWNAPEVLPAHQIFGCNAQEAGNRLSSMGMPQTSLCGLPNNRIRPSDPPPPPGFLDCSGKDEFAPVAPKAVGEPVAQSPPHLRTKLRASVKSLGSKDCVMCETEVAREPCALLRCGHRTHIDCFDEVRIHHRQCGICAQRRERIEAIKDGLYKKAKLICCL